MNDLLNLCRTCGSLINQEQDLKLFEKSNYALVTLIEDITDMWIEFDHNLPEFICIHCKNLLDQILQFRDVCLSTHKKMLEARKNNIRKQNNGKDPEECVVVNTEENIDTLDIKHIVDYISYSDTPLSEHISTEERNQVPPPNKTCQSGMNRNKTPKKLRKNWVCEQCGGVFMCSTYLKLHLLRHTGKKEFECDICKRRYYTQNEMLRHKILHSNARPYACRYCDKTFRGTSSKAVHERTHTNERPFACKFCEKTFRSTSVRKMHERVHDNNRKYYCEPCNQWFLRSSHLSLHQRTKMHKSKVPPVE